MNENVLSCITAYYPGNEFENVCRIIAQQTGFLLIIDNSTDNSLAGQQLTFSDNVKVIANSNRYALSGAFNIALQYAKDNGFEYLHIFDQDTVPPNDITTLLLKNFQDNNDVAIVSPRFLNSSTNFPGRVLAGISNWKVKSVWPNMDQGPIKALFTISSASLISINKLPQEAFYDTRLIIDGCDIDFCLSLKDAGLQVLVDPSVTVIHGLGGRRKGGGRWSATNYSPERKQLSAKNRVMIWRRYWDNYPGYVLNDLGVFILDSGRTVLLEKQRIKKIAALITGIWQGLREKTIEKRIGS